MTQPKREYTLNVQTLGLSMSLHLFTSDILFLQRILKISGFYAGPLDGKWSAAVDSAEASFEADFAATRNRLGAFDSRSERNVASLIPAAQEKARRFLAVARTFPHDARIISGTRTYAEQNALYAIGRTVETKRKPVTNAKGGRSNHNFSIAWDVGLFDRGRYLDGRKKGDDKAYADLAALIKAQVPGLEWGGDWKTFPDLPHYQVVAKGPLAFVRAQFEAGTAYV